MKSPNLRKALTSLTKNKRLLLTQEQLKQKLTYNPDTGLFYWITSGKGRNLKKPAGGINNSKGYISIGINGNKYYAHQLTFLYMEGYLPENDVDHINRITSDNSWDNLREVSKSCNAKNIGILNSNTSGITGVSLHKHTGKWQVFICVNNNNIYLGYFDDFDQAVLARWNAEVKYDFPNCNSTSSAYQFLLDNNLINNECLTDK